MNKNTDYKDPDTGIEFLYGENDLFRYYTHTDDHGWIWDVAQNLRKTYWSAYVQERGKNGRAYVLNTATLGLNGKMVSKGPLYDIPATDLRLLLAETAKLIRAGEWPEEIELRKDGNLQQ